VKLREAIELYVAFRKSAGADFRSSEHLLATFCRSVTKEVNLEDVDEEHVAVFLRGKGNFTGYWHRKHSALLGFYRYAVSRGYVSRLPVPTTVPKQPAAVTPYIYSQDELRRLLDATERYRKWKHRLLLEPRTFRTLLLLLYGAGLRGCEARRLKLSDVNTAAAMLTIRDTKFYKTRLVPLGPDLNGVIAEYAEWRVAVHPLRNGDESLFVDRKGALLQDYAVRRAFADLRIAAGVRRNDGARYQPRLHDLRHGFAVDRLTAWYREGKDVQKLLPALSTYLGHINIAATQVYLTMTPELLRQACRRFERYAFGEGGHE
jgi:site-specific recombinase XerD